MHGWQWLTPKQLHWPFSNSKFSVTIVSESSSNLQLYNHYKMASKSFARTALRATRQKAATPAVPKRSFVSAPATRPVVQASTKAIVAPTQSRGLKTIDFAGTKEDVFGTLLESVQIHH